MRSFVDNWQEATVSTNLMDNAAVRKHKDQSPGTAAIQQSKAILSFEDVVEGPDFSIDDHGVPEEFGVPDRGYVGGCDGVGTVGTSIPIEVFTGGGIEQAAIGIEAAVLDTEWHLKGASWQIECRFDFVTDEVEAGEARVDVESGGPHGMVVIPEG